MSDKRKQSLYFPEEMLNEIQMKQTDRTVPCLGLSSSRKVARGEIKRFPSVNDVMGADPREEA